MGWCQRVGLGGSDGDVRLIEFLVSHGDVMVLVW